MSVLMFVYLCVCLAGHCSETVCFSLFVCFLFYVRDAKFEKRKGTYAFSPCLSLYFCVFVFLTRMTKFESAIVMYVLSVSLFAARAHVPHAYCKV